MWPIIRPTRLYLLWNMARGLDQINALNPTNPFDFELLTLELRSEQIGRLETGFPAKWQRTIGTTFPLAIRPPQPACAEFGSLDHEWCPANLLQADSREDPGSTCCEPTTLSPLVLGGMRQGEWDNRVTFVRHRQKGSLRCRSFQNRE